MTGLEAAVEAVRRGWYRVDEDGSVWKVAAGLRRDPLPEPVRAERQGPDGYLRVFLHLDGKQYATTAHRLVWAVLHGTPPRRLDINHIDGVKTNNHPSNLELSTRSHNLRHAVRTGLRKHSQLPTKLSAKAKRLRRQGLSYKAIGEQLGVSQTTAFKAVKA